MTGGTWREALDTHNPHKRVPPKQVSSCQNRTKAPQQLWHPKKAYLLPCATKALGVSIRLAMLIAPSVWSDPTSPWSWPVHTIFGGKHLSAWVAKVTLLITLNYHPVSTYGCTALLDLGTHCKWRIVTWYSFTVPPLKKFAVNDVACHRFIDRRKFAFFI